MGLKRLNMFVVSFCDIPEDIRNDSDDSAILEEGQCDSYIEWTLNDAFEPSELDKWFLETYPELKNSKFLIHIDY